jgi:hypothetical protein
VAVLGELLAGQAWLVGGRKGDGTVTAACAAVLTPEGRR